MKYMDYLDKRKLIESLPQVSLIALTIFAEARGEPYEGKVQVGWVAFRREVNNLKWDDILDKSQFSCYNFPAKENDILNFIELINIKLLDPVMIECQKIAAGILSRTIPEPLDRATHYFNPDVVLPLWAASMKFLGKIGKHVFYRDESAVEIA